MRTAACTAACLALAVLGSRTDAPSRHSPLAADLDAVETVYRFLFERTGWAGARYYCVGSGDWDAYHDPPSELLSRLDTHRPTVVPISKCEMTPETAVHRASAEPAQIFLTDLVQRDGESQATVLARFHVRAGYAGGFSCHATRTPDGWTADCYLVEMR